VFSRTVSVVLADVVNTIVDRERRG
jgi:hypothetical protein